MPFIWLARVWLRRSRAQPSKVIITVYFHCLIEGRWQARRTRLRSGPVFWKVFLKVSSLAASLQTLRRVYEWSLFLRAKFNQINLIWSKNNRLIIISALLLSCLARGVARTQNRRVIQAVAVGFRLNFVVNHTITLCNGLIHVICRGTFTLIHKKATEIVFNEQIKFPSPLFIKGLVCMTTSSLGLLKLMLKDKLPVFWQDLNWRDIIAKRHVRVAKNSFRIVAFQFIAAHRRR